MKKRQQPNVEGIWADPEAVLRPTKGERLAALIQEFEDEQYPQMMALGWLKQTLDRLPQNQTSLRSVVDQAIHELVHLLLFFEIIKEDAHHQRAECTGELALLLPPLPMDAIEEQQRTDLAELHFEDDADEIDSAETAERYTIREEWYCEKQSAAWIVETLNMLPLEKHFSRVREPLVAARRALLRRMSELEEAVGFDWVIFYES
jgi:hypothetical protein